MSEESAATATATEKKGGSMGSGTVGGLIAFCDYLIDKGIATASAITPLKSAVRQVFETVEGTDEIDEIDVRSLDVDEYLNRFQVKAMQTGRYKPESVTQYQKRFTRAMDYYSDYLTSGAVPKFKPRSVPSGRKSRSPVASDGPSPAKASATEPVVEPVGEASGGMISYPFPLEVGSLANLRLPVRLSRTDAERLAAFIRTLVFEPQKEITASSESEDQG